MSRKKSILIVGVFVLLSSAFILSFNWGMQKFYDAQNAENNLSNQPTDNIDKYTSSNIDLENIVTQNSKITLKLEYTKGEFFETKELEAKGFIGKSKADLEREGYLVESMSSSEVDLYKKVDSYAPDKYVLGVKGDCLAIYKTDENGNMFIEDETMDVSEIPVPTKEDYNLLVKGSKDLQFDNKEDAEAKLGEYDS